MLSPEFLALQRAVKGRYSLDRELGRGGMGIVFLARDVALDRLVAIKLLPPEVAHDPALRERFLREARTAANLSHPNVIPIHAVEETGGVVFFVMSYIDGDTLGDRVRRAGPLSATDTMRVTQEIAWALGHAHGRGVIHRDMKPDNVILERDSGRTIVMDFGIARVVEEAAAGSGPVMGTPKYMSPEQAAGDPVDGRADLYSLGVTVFYAATGRGPFEGTGAAALMLQHAVESAPALGPLAPRLPARFVAAIDRCLAKRPSDRFASAEEFAQEVAAARGALTEMPAPLRRFAREANVVGSEAGGYLLGALGVAAALEIFKVVEGDWLGVAAAIQVLMVTLFAGLSATRVARLVPLARDLLKQGYDHRAFVAGLTVEERRLEDEAPTGDGQALHHWMTAAGGAALTGLGLVAMAGEGDVLIVFGTALAIGTPLLTLRRLWDRLGGTRLFGKLLRGRFGKRLFQLAGVGLDRTAPLPTAGERTELALGRVVDQLYRSLPRDVQRRVGDVPTLVSRIEADALALRERASKEPAAAQRLALAVAALETLRLDLLLAASGQAGVDELTASLERVRNIGNEVQARADAQDDIAAELSPIPDG